MRTKFTHVFFALLAALAPSAFSQNLTFTIGEHSFEMVYVKGGSFVMGAQADDASAYNYDSDAYTDEGPTHEVELGDFHIGKFQVTQNIWKAVMGYQPTFDGNSWFDECGLSDEHPAYYVSYYDVMDFLDMLNFYLQESGQLPEGAFFNFPTEAQWEYAARGGANQDSFKYPGSDVLEEVAWYSENSDSKTHKVGQKLPNSLGIYDMGGNVLEWCYDIYGPYSAEKATNPTGAANGTTCVLRGGGYHRHSKTCRVSYRANAIPEARLNYQGVRLALNNYKSEETALPLAEKQPKTEMFQSENFVVLNNLKNNTTVQLLSITGEKISEATAANNTARIDVSGLKKGIYLVQTEDCVFKLILR